jgi:glycerol-3-phosphate acyltransferase PlsY
MAALPYVGVAALAYLIGSIPTGALLARAYRNVDLTAVGSGSTGATNAARFLGPGAGALVLLGDFAKGMLAVWIAMQTVGTPAAIGLAGFVAVLAHTRSIFLRGRGGRGVVTGLGGLSLAIPGLFLMAALVGCVVVVATRYVSLGSISGSATALLGGLVAYATGQIPLELAIYVVATALVVIVAHGDNIGRLRAGTERRIGRSATTSPPAAS